MGREQGLHMYMNGEGFQNKTKLKIGKKKKRKKRNHLCACGLQRQVLCRAKTGPPSRIPEVGRSRGPLVQVKRLAFVLYYYVSLELEQETWPANPVPFALLSAFLSCPNCSPPRSRSYSRSQCPLQGCWGYCNPSPLQVSLFHIRYCCCYYRYCC